MASESTMGGEGGDAVSPRDLRHLSLAGGVRVVSLVVVSKDEGRVDSLVEE